MKPPRKIKLGHNSEVTIFAKCFRSIEMRINITMKIHENERSKFAKLEPPRAKLKCKLAGVRSLVHKTGRKSL